jgi:hypothetical protein
VMFAFILSVLNGDLPPWEFFEASPAPHVWKRARTRKPQDGGPDQPPSEGGAGDSSLMDTSLDPTPALPAARPAESSGPSGLASLPSAPSGVEEQDPTAVYAAPTSASALALGSFSPSPPSPLRGPSLELDSSTLAKIVAWASGPSGAFASLPPVAGKHSQSSSPSTSSLSGGIPVLTSPPPPVGTYAPQQAPDWQVWITAHHRLRLGGLWPLQASPSNLEDAAVAIAAASAAAPSAFPPLGSTPRPFGHSGLPSTP